MLLSAAAIVLFVKLGLLRAIDSIANALNWPAKTRGQITGYATSVPELVCLVSAGIAGVWEAGLWNIASSNIINAVLMMLAVLFYRQFNDLMNIRFLDEVVFAALAIVVPIFLMHVGMDTQWYLVPALLCFFVVYQLVDRKINRPTTDEGPARKTVGNLPFGIILGLSALIAITIAGVFLGSATADVVEELGVRPALAGWILGFATSIPEMVTFFAIYATARRHGNLRSLEDTQESLDNLTGSNMSNVGVVYPLGLLAFLSAAYVIGA
jgi:Ca2+/Na+ antiporter